MGLRINTNLLSLSVQRQLSTTTAALTSHYRRLSTGLRITSAADDPAGLAISERMRARVRSLAAAGRNVQDGISLVQTAEGALSEYSNLLVRARELILAANNGTASAADIQALDEEYQAIGQELERLSQATTYNGIELLNSDQTIQIAAGADPGDTIDIDLESLPALLGNVMGAFDLTTASGRNISMFIVDYSVDYISGLRSRFGATQNRLESAGRSLANAAENLSAAESRIRDADLALETAGLVRAQILQQAGIALLAQANQAPALALRLLQSPQS